MSVRNLGPDEFDAAFTRVHVREDRLIWTAKAIADRLGCSVQFVRRTLAKEPGSPIRQRGRKLYVYETALEQFMRSKPNKVT